MGSWKLGRWLCVLPAMMAMLAQAETGTVHERFLRNGMKVIVKEDRRSPTVAHMVWYRAGSMDEPSGATGVAHVLEHMMFKGTKTVGPGEFSRRVAAMGGRENAFTSRDYTAYYQQIDSSQLDKVMALEADRMRNLVIGDREFSREIRVIMEERRWRTEDRATGLMHEALYSTAFTAHPYRHPTIGWMGDLEQMTSQDVKNWYQRWYAPNNATLVVVGGVDAGRVLAMAEKHFGRIPARRLPAARDHREPPQRGMRRVAVKAPAENPMVWLAFKVPALRDVEKDDDVYALDVLEAILDGYDNARLGAALVRRERIANAVGASYSAIGRGPSLFVLEATPAPGVGTLALEKRLREEIDRIAKEGVTEAELHRVKAQLIAGQVYKRDSVFGQAMEIGLLEMAGIGHGRIDHIVARLRSVTAQQVQAVAQKYFGDDALTIVTLIPLPIREKPASAPVTRH